MSQFLKSENLRGAGFMSMSMAGFAFNDAMIKLVAADISIYQSILIRGVIVTAMLGVFAWVRGAFKTKINRANHTIIWLRAMADVLATFAFLTALVYMPIANITAILQALPLTVTLGAALFMGERFGLKRGFAILIGFIGVLLIVRPGTDGFNAYSLLGILAVLFVTARDLLVRKLSKDVPTLYVAFITALAVCLAGAVITQLGGFWQPVSARQIGLLALASCFIFVGYYFAVASMRTGQVSVVAPFRYTIMIWAILLGWWVWGDIPDLITLAGMAVVIGMGIFTLLRERAVKPETEIPTKAIR